MPIHPGQKSSNKKFNPEVTAIMPNLNMSKYLSEAIESILNQTFSNFEFLIADNGSTDNSCEIINSYIKKDTRIKLFQTNKLIYSSSLNFLIKQSKSNLILRMDADDVSLPNRIEVQKNFLEKNSDVSVVSSDTNLIDKNNKILKTISTKNVEKKLYFYNCIAHSSVMFKKIPFLSLGGYNPLYEPAEDYYLWITFLKNGYKIKNIPKVLLNYRVHDQSVSSKRIKEQFFKTMLIKKDLRMPIKKKIINYNFINFKLYRKYMINNLDYSQEDLAYLYFLFFINFLKDMKFSYAFICLYKSLITDFYNISKIIFILLIKSKN